MANLKNLKTRIKSAKSTQKIIKAMKMVAAAKLKRAQDRAREAEPYAEEMMRVIRRIAHNTTSPSEKIKSLMGDSSNATKYLVVVATSNRGLCGSFNSSLTKAAKKYVASLLEQGKEIKILCVGRKAYDQLKPYYKSLIIDVIDNLDKDGPTYKNALTINNMIFSMFEKNEFEVCSIIYNKFKTAISQEVTNDQIIPVQIADVNEYNNDSEEVKEYLAPYEYEPSEEEVLEQFLPLNVSVQIYHALLENYASEQGARMTAMDNASRNAGEKIKDLTLLYNRTRQAAITKELIEIISGAEAI